MTALLDNLEATAEENRRLLGALARCKCRQRVGAPYRPAADGWTYLCEQDRTPIVPVEGMEVDVTYECADGTRGTRRAWRDRRSRCWAWWDVTAQHKMVLHVAAETGVRVVAWRHCAPAAQG